MKGRGVSKTLCISQFHLRPVPPGYCGAFSGLVSPGGGAFANFVLPGGRAFANPQVGAGGLAPMHDYVRRVNFTNKPRL